MESKFNYIKKKIFTLSDATPAIGSGVKSVSGYFPDITLLDKPVSQYKPFFKEGMKIQSVCRYGSINYNSNGSTLNDEIFNRTTVEKFGKLIIKPNLLGSLIGYSFEGVFPESVTNEMIISIIKDNIEKITAFHLKDKREVLEKALLNCSS